MHYFDQRLASTLMQRRLDQRERTGATDVPVDALKARIGQWAAARRTRLAGRLTRLASKAPRPA